MRYEFTPKWLTGETTTIRIPKILKEQILSIARELDRSAADKLLADITK